MNLKELATAVAKKEGKLSQVKIGDIREIIRILSDIEAEMRLKGEDRWTPSLLIRRRAKEIMGGKKDNSPGVFE